MTPIIVDSAGRAQTPQQSMVMNHIANCARTAILRPVSVTLPPKGWTPRGGGDQGARV